jgi:hypothetical protein
MAEARRAFPTSPLRRATALLAHAARLHDTEGSTLARTAPDAWRRGFRSGASWMAAAMSLTRGSAVPNSLPRASGLGTLKYTLALLAALLTGAVGGWLGLPAVLRLLLAVASFYAVEVQGVFLFPAALDGAAHPWRRSRALMREAGGTLSAMGTVGVLAVVMLGGGLVGRGWVRCWCLGCLAVVLWYEDVRA